MRNGGNDSAARSSLDRCLRPNGGNRVNGGGGRYQDGTGLSSTPEEERTWKQDKKKSERGSTADLGKKAEGFVS